MGDPTRLPSMYAHVSPSKFKYEEKWALWQETPGHVRSRET